MVAETAQQQGGLHRALHTRREAQQLGRVIASVLGPGDLVVLQGDLGAGKTTLVRSIVRGLGVPASVPVTSPTFELVHELEGRMPIVHADLYRLGEGEDLDELGLIPRIGADAVVLVEWGDKFVDQLGDQGLWVSIDLEHGSDRSVRLHGRGARGEALISALSPLLSASSSDAD